jgi:hypothetical protein
MSLKHGFSVIPSREKSVDRLGGWSLLRNGRQQVPNTVWVTLIEIQPNELLEGRSPFSGYVPRS